MHVRNSHKNDKNYVVVTLLHVCRERVVRLLLQVLLLTSSISSSNSFTDTSSVGDEAVDSEPESGLLTVPLENTPTFEVEN